MTKECKKCKKLCIRCTHFTEGGIMSMPLCRNTEIKKMNCVNGEIKTTYTPCSEINRDGNCPNWELDKGKDLTERLKAVLHEYNHRHFGVNSSDCPNIRNHLVCSLLVDLNGHDGDFYISCDSNDDGILCYKYDSDGRVTDHYKKWKKRHTK